MSKFFAVIAILLLAGAAQAYSIKYSYPGKQNSTEYYGACNDGQMLKIVQHSNGQYDWEGPNGTGATSGNGALDKAAAAACGE